MQITMDTSRCISPDGWSVFSAEKGKTYDLPEIAALPLLRSGWAYRPDVEGSYEAMQQLRARQVGMNEIMLRAFAPLPSRQRQPQEG